MKLGVYVNNRPKLDPDLFLSLEESEEGVSLIVVDVQGSTISRGNILRINNDGTFFRFESVAEDIGFQLDKKRRIKERRE